MATTLESLRATRDKLSQEDPTGGRFWVVVSECCQAGMLTWECEQGSYTWTCTACGEPCELAEFDVLAEPEPSA